MASKKDKAEAPEPKPNTLGSYRSGLYGAELAIAPAKVGKTVTILGNSLGVFPWQDYGGVVDTPSSCHVITFDSVTLDGSLDFLVNQCGAPREVQDVHVINLEAATKKAMHSGTEYDPTFPTAVYDALHKCQDLTSRGGVHVIIWSSFTMLAKAWLRSISGPAFGAKKSAMDRNKWAQFADQMTEFQFQAQDLEKYHTIWEAHWTEKESMKTDSTGSKKVYDTIQVQGKTAEQFPQQCARPYMLTRKKGGWQQGSKVDLVEWDTQPDLEFGQSMMAGRKVVGNLEPKERDLTLMFNKLGLAIGGWGT